jgi:chaperonin cofactor prefoldin
MQAEGGRVYIQEDNASMQENLVAQRANLEQKLHDITLQIAKLDIALEEHEKASLEGTETEASSQSQSE